MSAPLNIAPTPWRVGPVDDTTISAADRSEVATVDGDYNDPDTWPIMEANARLMAAAPDLYEALVSLRSRFHAACLAAGSDAEFVEGCTPDADAAIAKARGGKVA